MGDKAFFLQQNTDGVSLHGHLTELIHSLLTSKDPNALEKLESLSLDVKAKHFKAAEAGTRNLPPAPAPNDNRWNKRSNQLHTTAALDDDDDGVPNVIEDMKLFSWAGVGISQEDAYRLFLAMTKLRASEGLKSLRFFGKILGTKRDYYVVESMLPPAPPAMPVKEPKVPAEAPGAGLNSCTYFVTHDLAEPFVKLPDVTPAQVVVAASIKKFFTGELEAPVRCYPPFPGKEAAYLRAQLARIATATVLVPAGKFKFDEEVEEAPPVIPTPADEYEAKAPDEMLEADNWCHLFPGILKIGRCTNPPKPEEEEEEAGDAEPEEPEEEVPALMAVSADAQISELTLVPDGEPIALPAWSTSLALNQGTGKEYAVAIAKSHRWPGAYSAAAMKEGKFASVYIGYGSENSGSSFTPAPPPFLLPEAADVDEQPEVTLEAENALLKEIEDAKMGAEAAAEEGEE